MPEKLDSGTTITPMTQALPNSLEWHEAVEIVKPHVVQIRTPQGSGTGFFLWREEQNPEFHAVATAAHVIEHSRYWEQPIRIQVAATKETVLLRPDDRAIYADAVSDTAVVLFNSKKPLFPPKPLKLVPKKENEMLRVGVTIGWLGFPAIPGADLCFFTGPISSWIGEHSAYFVDGVAINGVSGGPAFADIGGLYIIGVVSAYMPNRATGETLPGLGIVRDVMHLHKTVQGFDSFGEAKAQEAPATEPPPPPPPPSSPPASNNGRGTT